MSAALALQTAAIDQWNPCTSHPFRKIIQAWVRDNGVHPDHAESTDESRISWTFGADQRISVVVSLYPDETDRVYFLMECAIARSIGFQSAEVAQTLMELNRTFYEIFRTAMLEDGTALCLARGRAEGITPEYFRRMLDELIAFSQHVQKILIEKHGVEPFCDAPSDSPQT